MLKQIIGQKCTGCEACVSHCPSGCIRMEADSEGFFYPEIDDSSCIQCRRCLQNCPVLNFQKNHDCLIDMKKAYAFRSNREEQRKLSSSGGAFLTVATRFITTGGVVVGAAFDSDFHLFHKIAVTCEELIPLAGSKYLQSRIGDIYQTINQLLKKGTKVLFVGTTCQVEGLRSVINEEEKNLYCIDLICMGIPSPMVWEKYVTAFFEKEKICRINFKDKRLGWHKFSFTLEKKDGSTISVPGKDNPYMECMFKGYSVRPSCFSCIYKCESKSADMTIADCWGCENFASKMDDDKGLSMVICHNEKGMYLKDILEKMGEILEIDYRNVLEYNSYYQKSLETRMGRKLFYSLLRLWPRMSFSLMGTNPDSGIIQKIKNRLRPNWRKRA